MKVVLVTGGFDPLHSGHISYFKEAKKLGDKLVVGLNSDKWLARKKGKPFMPIQERVEIVKNLQMVDDVLCWDDDDDSAGAVESSCSAVTLLWRPKRWPSPISRPKEELCAGGTDIDLMPIRCSQALAASR